MNETLRVLKERRSVRRYKAEQITEAELNAVLEAGTWAPSAKGLQTSVMVVVQDPETPFTGPPPWWWSWETGRS